MQRIRSLLILAIAAWLAPWSTATAQVPGVQPTPEQLQALQSMTPEERQALLDQAGGSNAGTNGAPPLTTVGANPDRSTTNGKRSLGEGAPSQRAGDRSTERNGDKGTRKPEPEYQLDAKGKPVLGADGKPKLKLMPFGYDIFSRATGNFEPEAAIPVPNDYVLGPGDKVEVQLYGNERQNLILVVGRDGLVRMPKLGPVHVGGMRFEEVKELVEGRVAREFVGTQVSLSMGELRSIRVFILGDVDKPGSYLVSALATMSNALLVAGGPTENGSLRDVQLKRSGAIISHLDAYDLLLQGDTSHDARLLAGDVVFVPPVGTTASIDGEVRRPAIYELKPGDTVSHLIALSGGLKPEADPHAARIRRINDKRQVVTVDANIAVPEGRQLALRTGDELVIQPVRPSLLGSVEVKGAVFRERSFEHHPGIRLSEVIGSLDELKPDGDPHYLVIRRQPVQAGPVTTVDADLQAALAAPGTAADPVLEARDRITVLTRNPERAKDELTALVDELRAQARIDAPAALAQVGGSVPYPGEYPLHAGMRVSDLLRAAGTPSEAALGSSAELVRYEVVGGEKRQTELVNVDLAAIRNGDKAQDLLVRPYDLLTVKQLQDWGKTEYVTLKGEVRFPGDYPVRRGDTLASVIKRAGGFTDEAYLKGAVFIRESIKEQEQVQINRLADRLQNDLTVLALRNSQNPDAKLASETQNSLSAGRSLLGDLRATKAVGRMVVDLPALLKDKGSDVEVFAGDELLVPRTPHSVAVLGEVQAPISHIWQADLGRDDYIYESGGTTAKADKRRIYVVHPDGRVDVKRGGWFFGTGGKVGAVQPGDSIVVPADAERMRALPTWASVTQIIYNLAIAAAAAKVF